MEINIRKYSNSDFQMIYSWWTDQKEHPPIDGMMIEDGTFILELNNIPALSLTVFKTQSREMAYLEGFIKNPQFKQSLHSYSKILWNHAFLYAKNEGYKRVICLCAVDKLENKYIDLGMTKTAKNLSSFAREI